MSAMVQERFPRLALWIVAWTALPFSLAAAPQAGDDDDPFSPKNQAPLTRPEKPSASTERIVFEASVKPTPARRGEIVTLEIKGTPRSGFHTYPVGQRTADQLESGLSRITFAPDKDLKPIPPLRESEPELEHVKGVGDYLEYRGPFTWTQDILVSPDAKPGARTLSLTVRAQVCDKTCVWADFPLEVRVEVSEAPPAPLSAELKARLQAPPPAIKVVGALGPDVAAPAGVQPGGAAQPSGLAGLLLASVGAAIAMLFTPCVFPMIPITVSFFLKQGEKEHHNALLTACVYSVTIIVVLALSVLVLGELIVRLANNAWLNLGLGGLLVFFALSLFGMYEIELPSGLARFTSAHEGKGGYLGAVFMSLTFTITSFTCTGPFLGPLLVAVKEYRLSFGERLLGAFFYSATFAAPFFVLALFPTLMKKLPKSGGWLNAVKVVMGFLELAAALKFLANTDLAFNPGNPWLFNYETVLCAWVALSVLCGCYLLGVFRLPHDSPVEHVGVARMLLASIFLGLSLYMAPLLWRVTPQGVVGRGLVAFLPLDTRLTPAGSQAAQAELTWHRDYQKAWELANKEGKLIFIDFTGQNCTNCRFNEKNVFPQPAIHDELSKYVRVQLYTDFVPDPSLSMSESEGLATRFRNLQNGTFGDLTTPLYAIIKPDRETPFETVPDRGQRFKGQVLGVRKGLIEESQVKDFEQFLSEPLTRQGRAAAGPAALTGSQVAQSK